MTATDHAADPAYLALQYARAEHLRVRYETHARVQRRRSVLPALGGRTARRSAPAHVVCDIGCGPGAYHAAIAAAGARVIAIDQSAGMLREARENADRRTTRHTLHQCVGGAIAAHGRRLRSRARGAHALSRRGSAGCAARDAARAQTGRPRRDHGQRRRADAAGGHRGGRRDGARGSDTHRKSIAPLFAR